MSHLCQGEINYIVEILEATFEDNVEIEACRH